VSSPEQEHITGMGLGLYIAAEIVKMQGGTMQVESRAGEGSTFSFTIPAERFFAAAQNDTQSGSE